MEIRVIVEDRFVYIDGVQVHVDQIPEQYQNIKAIQSIDGKTHILYKDENGVFVDDFDLSPIIFEHRKKTEEIKLKEEAVKEEYEKYLLSPKAEIHRLESQITNRRMREAALGTDNGWLAEQEALIAVERAKI